MQVPSISSGLRTVRGPVTLLVLTALLLAGAALLPAGTAYGEESRWMRYPAISPDGSTLVFSWRGDLWRVPAVGGEARLLTTHEGYEAWPVWSPDSRRIAFASDRHGSLDVHVVDAFGGAAERLTFHSADDVPTAFSPDGERLFFTADRAHAARALLGAGAFGELYSVAVDGGVPRQELTTPADGARFSPDGRRMAYEEVRAYENRWRKHHTSSASRDLWIWDRETDRHLPLTDFRGEDREPVWLDGSSVAFLSERGGSSNVWTTAVGVSGAEGEARPLTDHGPHPVRFLSAADDGTLAYGYHGEIWTLAPGGEPRRVEIEITGDERSNPVLRHVYRDRATEMAVSPFGDEVAFVVRGEIFVASAEHGTTRRLTETPEQERSLAWAPDGRTLYFAAERDRSWNLYALSLEDDGEDRFFAGTAFQERPVLVGEDETFQPLPSPDGKSLAFLHNRDEVRLLDLEDGSQKVLLPSHLAYSYADGDISFRFSPDGKRLATSYTPHRRWIDEIALIDLESGEIHNVTESGYDEGRPLFSADGQTLYFVSDRTGMRSHGGHGSQSEVFAVDLNRRAWERSRLSVEDFERRRKKEEKEKQGKTDEGRDQESEEPPKAEPVEPVTVELRDFDHRTRRLTLHPSTLADYAVSRDGEVVFYLSQVETGFDLWLSRPRYGETRRLATLGEDRPGSLELSRDGRRLFLLSGQGKISRLDVGDLVESKKAGRRGPAGPGATLEPVSFQAEMTVDRREERAHLFEHVWRQVQRKFYVEDLHGADWDALKRDYGAFVEDLRHGRDFAELLSELLGELNASHTGAGYRARSEDHDRTASLGLIYDLAHEGPGLLVADVLRRGPADRSESRIAPGVTITHIDGEELAPTVNPWALLNRKEGRRVRLGLRGADGENWEEILEPVSGQEERELRYERWIERLRAMTEKLSGGRIGYVHVQGMNDASFRRFYRDTLGRMSDKKALIVDTRWNGGGWLHDDLAAFLQGRDYLTVTPRGKEPGTFGTESLKRWTRPVAVLQNEANYSDAHIFPWTFKELDLGLLVGAPVAGTGTAVWWERLIDPDLVFGIPQVGMIDPRGNFMENQDLHPDIEVQNTAESIARGEDAQLAAAVEALLADLEEETGSANHAAR